ncbi:zinc finger protein [Macleaya cordata]|uniref:Zinc finger protein n=1 Tax=Macleaya cordata TaxID=56857 RepID=A0A200QX85_MACCD|nr:zinc finger protein [Macleaya cordata]
MTQNSLFLLLLRNTSSRNPNFRLRFPSLIRGIRTFQYSNGGNTKSFSTSQSSIQQTENDLPNPSDPKTSLSARMSFVFDQIDAIEKERGNKDEALQRIRAWRETKKKKNDEESSELRHSDSSELKSSSDTEVETKKKGNLFTKEIEMVHPWPEWIELMERLVQQNYFDHRRSDEDKLVQNLPIDLSEFAEDGFDFTRDWTTVRNACVNFGRDRFDILRSLSRQDIQILVGYGCPSVDTKVVFSAKMLRKYVHLDEGDVCSSCSLRSSCEKAYLLARKEDEARTLDVIRILLTFGFDPIKGSVENKPLLKMKSVKTVVRKLLHEVVKLSAVPIDPNLPPPIIKKPPPKVKQPPPPPKKRVGRDDIEMKKGDWLCPKCDFMNFAKNSVCLQCDAKRPKRQLLPGEWECPGCNFLNYRRNMACFHCDHKRPPDEFMENQTQARTHGPRTRLERVASMPGVSNAWNFDFDDNESDGADVAAFEFADSPRMGEDSSLQSEEGGRLRGFEDDSFRTSRTPRAHERGRHPELDERKPTTGFDDFDDEEDDDVNSYELVSANNNSMQEASLKDLSEVEGYSESEDFDGSNRHSHARRGANFPARFEDRGHDFDSEEEDSVHPNWKSSHIANSRNGSRGRGGSGPYRGLKFDSGDEFERESASDDDVQQGFGPNHRQRSKWSSNRKGLRKGGSSDSEDGLQFGSESDDDLHSRNKPRGRKPGPDRRGNTSKGRGQFASARDARFRSNDMNDRRNSFGNADIDRSFRGSQRNNRGSQGDEYGGRRMNDRQGNSRNFVRGGNGNGFGYQQRGRSNDFNDRPEMRKDFGDDRPRRRIIER